MYIECQTCRYRNHKTCMIDGKYAEPNHIYICIKPLCENTYATQPNEPHPPKRPTAL